MQRGRATQAEMAEDNEAYAPAASTVALPPGLVAGRGLGARSMEQFSPMASSVVLSHHLANMARRNEEYSPSASTASIVTVAVDDEEIEPRGDAEKTRVDLHHDLNATRVDLRQMVNTTRVDLSRPDMTRVDLALPGPNETVVDLFPTPDEQKKYPFLVEFGEDDPVNPKNWGRAYRWFLTAFSGLLVLNATFASSAASGIVTDLMAHFSFSLEVASLTITVYVFGFCLGPLLWGPLSEEFGRRPVFIIGYLFYTGFTVGCALSKNTASIIIFRFLSGTFAAAPLTNTGAVLSDIWDADTRGKAMGMYTVAPFAGPALGPLVGGYISTSGTDWRWLFWVIAIFCGVCLIGTVFLMPETYAPVIIMQKAKRMRKESGDDRYFAPLERREAKGLGKVLEEFLARPFKMLFLEPMLLSITIYMSFVYGCLYLLFEAVPIVFIEGHHFSSGASGLMFLPLLVGAVLAVVFYLIFFGPRYTRFVAEYKPAPVPPEKRLEMAFIGAPIFAISFFWFGWTSFPSITFWAPMLAAGGVGFSTVLIFLPFFNYLIDTYLFMAASALAATTVVRSMFGAVFPLFATQLYDALDARWASTLIGCVALVMIPIPFLLYKYGPRMRQLSKFAPTKPPAAKPQAENTQSTEKPQAMV